METTFEYIIVGAGLAGVSAVEGMREIDREKPILLIGAEQELPYNRPPLTKKLWYGKMQVDEVFIHDRNYYEVNGVTTLFDTRVARVDPARKTVTDSRGVEYSYRKLLIATGGVPRKLAIDGGNIPEINYYRTLDGYRSLREGIDAGKTITMIGGGFIGSELTGSLRKNDATVTMIFPEPYLCARVFPKDLGMAMTERFRERGVEIATEDVPVSITRERGGFTILTGTGRRIRSDMIVAGTGIIPSVELAKNAGVEVGNGIVVNGNLQTSIPDIYAAGDNALVPYPALKRSLRLEHWDAARSQGKQAGRNMAGAEEAFTYLPAFFSRLFEFEYEAVGDISSERDVITDWVKENDTGTVYYLLDQKVCGVMACNLRDRIDAAREMIQAGERMLEARLEGALLR